MDLKRLSSRAKDLVDKRGGTEALKQDAEQLKGIAKGPGTLSDKAKAAVSALKQPGGEATPAAPAPAPKPAETAAKPERARAEEKVEGEGRGKHKHAGPGGGRGRRQGGGDADPAV